MPTQKPKKRRGAARSKTKSISQPSDVAVGHKMADGTIYAGVSPDTGAAMYTTSTDTPLPLPFDHAREYAAELDAHGHRDWRLPTKDELNVMFTNREAIGGFNLTGLGPAGSAYWSSSQKSKFDACNQRFRDGAQSWDYTGFHSNVRCIRSVHSFEPLVAKHR